MTQQDAPVVQNKRLLLVAGALGLVVAVIYNVHLAQVRRAGRGQTVLLLKVDADLRNGEKITRDVLREVPISSKNAANMQQVLTAGDKSFAIDQRVNRQIDKGEWLQWAHLTQEQSSDRPSGVLKRGMMALPVYVDHRRAPGKMLRTDDHVDLLGVFPGFSRTLTVIEGVRVVEIGGRVPRERLTGGVVQPAYEEGEQNLRKIAIEVSPEVARKLINVLSHEPRLHVLVRSFHDRDEFPSSPDVSRDVAKLAQGAAAGPAAPVIPPP